MSEQLYKPGTNAFFLCDFTKKLMAGNIGREEVLEAHEKMAAAGPKDFISAVDFLVQEQPVSLKMKKGVNKMLNVFYTHLNNLPQDDLEEDSFLGFLVSDNKAIVEQTTVFKPLIKEIQLNEKPSPELTVRISNALNALSKIENHYQVMENILFPFLEKQWPDHRCFQVLWSVHDDVREELRELLKLLEEGNWDLKRFNRLTGDLFFNIKTIIFREEKILIPAIIEAGFSKSLDDHRHEAAEIGWAFIESPVIEKKDDKPKMGKGDTTLEIGFSTGKMSVEQIELIFNHLPVDITFVDETDTVRYFSTPKKRTFTRTNSIIGRKVQNCHPPESVWMVEDILDAFRKGEQDDASFWIPFKEQFVYIQYFALREEDGTYRGTIEVTQDVKEIRELKGERRLLNWEKGS